MYQWVEDVGAATHMGHQESFHTIADGRFPMMSCGKGALGTPKLFTPPAQRQGKKQFGEKRGESTGPLPR